MSEEPKRLRRSCDLRPALSPDNAFPPRTAVTQQGAKGSGSSRKENPMRTLEVLLHRHHLFRRSKVGWARGEKALRLSRQGENVRRTLSAPRDGVECRLRFPALPAGTKPHTPGRSVAEDRE